MAPRRGALRRRGVPIALLITAVVAAMTTPLASAQAEKPGDGDALELGVVGFYNPRLMFSKYQPLADYLTEQTAHAWRLEISATYEQTVEDLCAGRLEVAYLGPLTYLLARNRCGAVPLVQLHTNDSDSYRSVILVRDDSDIQELGDLEGRSFGFGAPLSTSSHLVPRAMLREAGVGDRQGIEFRYYRHHERAARAVLLREVAACGIRDIVADKFLDRGMRAIERSGPIPNFPLVVRADADPALRRELLAALVDRPEQQPALAERIRGWDTELAGGFTRVSDEDFDPIRRLAERIFGPDYLSAPVSELRGEGSGS